MLELRDAGVVLHGRPVLAGIDLSFVEGERVVVLGVNGAGKTTLLKVLDALVPLTHGELRYRGAPLGSRALDDARLRRSFRADVGLLFQNVDAMLFCPTVAEEVAFGPRQLGLPDADERVARAVRALGLEPILARPPFELSGGEKKRVALAAVLAAGPKLLLLDEPTASLDPRTAADVIDVVMDLDVTVVAATHDLAIAEELGSRVVVLAPGRAGTLYDGPVEGFLGDERLVAESGLAHEHAHLHADRRHRHSHVHEHD